MRSSVEVSVIVPVFNRFNLAREAVTSALAQSDVDLEIIVIDDGSEEDVGLSSVLPNDDSISLVSIEHSGISVARNTGISCAKGEFVAFLDSDDLFHPQKLSRQVRELRRDTGAVWSCTGYVMQDVSRGHKEVVWLNDLPRKFWRQDCPIGSTSLVVRRSFLTDGGGFDTDLEVSEDWDLMIRLGECSSPKLLEEPLYTYRRGCGNISHEFDSKWEAAWNTVIKKHQLSGSSCPHYMDRVMDCND